MKYLVLTLFPITKKYRGHANSFQEMATDIALYNGSYYGNPDDKDLKEVEKYIESLLSECRFEFEKINDFTYRFGHTKSSGYVEYGSVVKIVTF